MRIYLIHTSTARFSHQASETTAASKAKLRDKANNSCHNITMNDNAGNSRIPHKTQGGLRGHLWRRVIHISMIFIPILYYYLAVPFLDRHHISEHKTLLVALLLVLALEAVRLWKGLIFFGHRDHEREQISSFCWGFSSIIIVFLFMPHTQHHEIAFALPIIGGCAIGDPWIGELRTFNVSLIVTIVSGTLLVGALWLLCAVIFHSPKWYALIGAPLAILGEYTKARWIDDNATMMLLPLIAVGMIHYL